MPTLLVQVLTRNWTISNCSFSYGAKVCVSHHHYYPSLLTISSGHARLLHVMALDQSLSRYQSALFARADHGVPANFSPFAPFPQGHDNIKLQTCCGDVDGSRRLQRNSFLPCSTSRLLTCSSFPRHALRPKLSPDPCTLFARAPMDHWHPPYIFTRYGDLQLSFPRKKTIRWRQMTMATLFFSSKLLSSMKSSSLLCLLLLYHFYLIIGFSTNNSEKFIFDKGMIATYAKSNGVYPDESFIDDCFDVFSLNFVRH